MRKISKTAFCADTYFERPVETDTILFHAGDKYGGVYIKQPAIYCDVCKKRDKLSSDQGLTYLYYEEIFIVDEDTWQFVPFTHKACVEIAKLGLLL